MAGKNHLKRSKLVEHLPPEEMCRCGKPKVSKPQQCPLHGVIPPFEGDGMCRCCSSCRGKCHDEV